MLKLALATSVSFALASKPNILYYSPSSGVTDHARIDLDQAALETATGVAAGTNVWTDVTNIYTKGGHSKPKSKCDITGGVTGTALASGAKLTVTMVGGGTRQVTVDSEAAVGATSVTLRYSVSGDRVEPTATACYRGGLPAPSQTDGCVANGNGVSNEATPRTFTLANCAQAQSAGRTLAGFSTKARKYMLDNKAGNPSNPCPTPDNSKGYKFGCPYVTYKPFFDYYCATGSSCNANGDYTNQIIVAATGAALTTLTNFNMDFRATASFHGGSTGPTGAAKKQVIKKGSKFLGAMMYAMREFEDAIDDCTGGVLTANELSNSGSGGYKSVHAWDEGVAFYVGSKMTPDMLSGVATTGGGTYSLSALGSQGHLSYSLANKRCQNFKTCGPTGDSKVGEAHANIELWPLFNAGQMEILTGNCGKAVPIKDAIMKKMRVPLVQGTLRYAYKLDKLAGDDEARAEGAIFAAGILPDVHTCSPSAAATIAAEMSLNKAGKVNFAAVKAAFESTYPCMGITCVNVGGLITGTGDYYAGASPCVDPPSAAALAAAGALGSEKDKTGETVGIAIGATCGVLALIMLAYVCRLVSAEKKGKPIFAKVGNTV